MFILNAGYLLFKMTSVQMFLTAIKDQIILFPLFYFKHQGSTRRAQTSTELLIPHMWDQWIWDFDPWCSKDPRQGSFISSPSCSCNLKVPVHPQSPKTLFGLPVAFWTRAHPDPVNQTTSDPSLQAPWLIVHDLPSPSPKAYPSSTWRGVLVSSYISLISLVFW